MNLTQSRRNLVISIDLTHWKRNLVISVCGGLLVLFLVLRFVYPSDRNIAYIGVHIDAKAIVAEVMGELRAMSDDEVRSIGAAERPCRSRLIECRGLSQTYITKLAAEELAKRASDKDTEFKERAQKAADTAAQAANESAFAAKRIAEANERAAQAAAESAWANKLSAWAAQRSAVAAEWNVWVTGLGFAIAVFGFLFGVLTWWDTRRLNLQPPTIGV